VNKVSKHSAELQDPAKKVKNILAICYILFMIFIVGGSYLNQQNQTKNNTDESSTINSQNPN
jgi:uncharacterized membrane protein